MVNLNEVKVTFFPYRTALVRKLVSLPRNACTDWEKQLARLAGVQIDNHTVYMVEGRDTDPVYVMFSDWSVYIGSEVEKLRW